MLRIFFQLSDVFLKCFDRFLELAFVASGSMNKFDVFFLFDPIQFLAQDSILVPSKKLLSPKFLPILTTSLRLRKAISLNMRTNEGRRTVQSQCDPVPLSFKKIHEVDIPVACGLNISAGKQTIHGNTDHDYKHLTGCRLILPYPVVCSIQFRKIHSLHKCTQKANRSSAGIMISISSGSFI